MESSKKVMFNLGMVLGMRFLLKKDAKELSFGILNLFLKIVYDGYDYCSGDKYGGCEK